MLHQLPIKLSASPHEHQYHEDRLIVKMRPTERSARIRSLSLPARAEIVEASPGLGMLDRLDRAGLIKQVTPLDLPAEREAVAIAPRSAVLALFRTGASDATRRPSSASGLCMVQATENADIGQLTLALADDPNVEYVSRVPIRYLQAKRKSARKKPGRQASAKGKKKGPKSKRSTIAATPPSPLTMWNLQKIRWQQARAAGLDAASSVRVAVLDTGIDVGHPDLPGAEITHVFDFGSPQARASDEDIVGHGTHVAGTIRALLNGEVGINGICDCELTAYKIFGDEPEFSDTDSGFEVYEYFVNPEMYHAALVRCLDDGMRVVNLSIGGFGIPSTAERVLFGDLIDSGCVVVAAMGNENTFQESYPAAIDGVIAVGATRPTDRRASFSNKGPHMALCAPGEGIWSTLPTYAGETARFRNPANGQIIPASRETDYDAWDGTSMASPHVAAAAALLLHQDPELTPADVRTMLTDNADKVPHMNGANFTAHYGFGRLNLERLAGT